MNGGRVLDAAIAAMIGVIAARILGAGDPRAMLAGYAMLTLTAAALPILAGALWLGFRRG